MKKVGKTTWPFRYDLNLIPYDYTVEVMNRGKGLDLPEEQCIVQERVTKTILRKKKYKKAKWVSGEALQIAEERREATGKEERERYIQLNAEFQRTARRNKGLLK